MFLKLFVYHDKIIHILAKTSIERRFVLNRHYYITFVYPRVVSIIMALEEVTVDLSETDEDTGVDNQNLECFSDVYKEEIQFKIGEDEVKTLRKELWTWYKELPTIPKPRLCQH